MQKPNLHPRNSGKNGYNFEQLTDACPELKAYVIKNQQGAESINFGHPKAVKALNKALLMANFALEYWDIPPDYLCPPIPGREDYIHHMADLLSLSQPQKQPTKVLDIGVGANCIYPIIGASLYQWEFVGVDIDPVAIENCSKIIQNNPKLADFISLQQQKNPDCIFKNIIQSDDQFSFSMCNPPFHASKEEMIKANQRKRNHLNIKNKNSLNFGGQNNELWCDGGELAFLQKMIAESAIYAKNCLWFSTLVSKKDNLPKLYKALNKVKALEIKTIEMGQGQKTSRVLAWRFF